MSSFIHPTAVVDEGAHVGKKSKIWHFSHVCGGARIGNNVSLGQGVFVAATAIIEDDCKIQNNVNIFDGVRLARGVFCGPNMTFTNVINPRALVSRKSEYLSTVVGEGATFGASVTVVCGVRLGCYCFVAAGAVITTDVKAYALMAGVPAKQVGWMDERGLRIPLPLTGQGEHNCEQTGNRYQLQGANLIKIPSIRSNESQAPRI